MTGDGLLRCAWCGWRLEEWLIGSNTPDPEARKPMRFKRTPGVIGDSVIVCPACYTAATSEEEDKS